MASAHDIQQRIHYAIGTGTYAEVEQELVGILQEDDALPDGGSQNATVPFDFLDVSSGDFAGNAQSFVDAAISKYTGGTWTANSAVPSPYDSLPSAQAFVDASVAAVSEEGSLVKYSPNGIVVAGAGSDEANGLYLSVGEGAWRNMNGCQINTDADNWTLNSASNSASLYYGSPAGSPLTSEWAVANGVEPVPTFNEEPTVYTDKNAAVPYASALAFSGAQAFVDTMSQVNLTEIMVGDLVGNEQIVINNNTTVSLDDFKTYINT